MTLLLRLLARLPIGKDTHLVRPLVHLGRRNVFLNPIKVLIDQIANRCFLSGFGVENRSKRTAFDQCCRELFMASSDQAPKIRRLCSPATDVKRSNLGNSSAAYSQGRSIHSSPTSNSSRIVRRPFA